MTAYKRSRQKPIITSIREGYGMKILSMVNQKGGVAKTTSAQNIGAALATDGCRVLIVDLDPQGSLTKSAGVRIGDGATVYEVLKGEADAAETITSAGNYDILPADIRLSAADMELIGTPGRDYLLKEALEGVAARYDVIIIDCSPSLGILTLMALTAANGVIVPVAAQYMPLEGTAQLMQTVELVQKRLNKGLKISGVIITLYDARRSLDREIAEAVRARFPSETFRTEVRIGAKIAEAPARGMDIFAYDPRGAGAAAYMDIAKELREREGI